MLYTVGYQKFTLETFIAELKHHRIELLVDVRTRPYSRKPEFNRNQLQPALERAGIEYAWEGKCLGGLSGHREDCYEERLVWLLEMARSELVCIMCVEHDAKDCHRGQWIAEDVAKQGIQVKHLPAPTEVQRKL